MPLVGHIYLKETCLIQARTFRVGDEQSRLIGGQWTNRRGLRKSGQACTVIQYTSAAVLSEHGPAGSIRGRSLVLIA